MVDVKNEKNNGLLAGISLPPSSRASRVSLFPFPFKRPPRRLASDQKRFCFYEQLSLQKATFDGFLSKIEQHFEKLRETFWKISSNLWKALSMVVHSSSVVNANVSSISLGICQILFFSLLYYTEMLSSSIYKTRSNTVNFRFCAPLLPPL